MTLLKKLAGPARDRDASCAAESGWSAAQAAKGMKQSTISVPALGKLKDVGTITLTAELAFFAFLLVLRSRKRFHGQLLATWLIMYSALRFGVELLRGDKIRGYLFEVNLAPINRLLGIDPTEATILTTSQTISLGAGLLGIVLYVWLSRSKGTAGS